MLCCVAATEEHSERRPRTKHGQGGGSAGSGSIPTASSRASSKKYHETTANIAESIEKAIASACDDMQLEDWESTECARAAVRKVRKKQIESESNGGSNREPGSPSGSVVSAESSSTWRSAQKDRKGGESLVPTGLATEKGASSSSKPIRVYVDGCFDIMHSGHYNVLRQARQLGDVLIAGVHSEAEIRRNKGPPVMSDDERVKIVKACKWVDEVAFDTPYQPSVATLDSVNADFCVHGDDLPVGADGGPHAYYEVQQAGRLQLVKRTEGVSTTDLVGRLLLATSEHLQMREKPSPDSPASMTTINEEDEDGGGHYARSAGSNFLPTSWRIAQFSNARAPTAEDTVVYIDGSWDLFHVGHVEVLEKAKAQGSFLLVGVHDDPTINRYLGKNYPIMNLHERVLNVLSCEFCDDVIIGAPWAVSDDMITTFNIQKVVAVSDPATGGPAAISPKPPQKATPKRNGQGKLDPNPYKLAKEKGIFSILDGIKGALTNELLVERIISNRDQYVNRNKTREKKELDYLQKDKTFIAERVGTAADGGAAAASRA